MAGLYVHIPFCARKCVYCDFYSIGSRNAPWRDYVDAVIAEGKMRIGELDVSEAIETFYVGGGTPSQMPIEELDRMISGLLKLYGSRWQVAEMTIEVNPDDVTTVAADAYRCIGFNRVSMGIQTFNDDELRTLNRRHTAEVAKKAYAILSPRFEDLSIDLMFGLPGQTCETWEETIGQAIAIGAPHVSAYSLMWEEGTALWKMRCQGRVKEAPEVDSEKMFNLLCDRLRDAGYEHYEISNFCKTGFRSRHNSSYWRGVRYIGLGASAHSYDGGRLRSVNCADVERYLGARLKGEAQELARSSEFLSDEELRDEFILTRMRTCEGIDLGEYASRFGDSACVRMIKNAVPHLNAGRLCREGNVVRLTRKGILTSDNIIVDLMM